MSDRQVPTVQPETEFYWKGAAEGRLMLKSCADCGPFFPPRPFCPACGGREVTEVRASGRATLDSYVINHMKAPGYTPPFIVALVKLEEGPRLMANIIDCPAEPEALTLDMPLEVAFERRGDLAVPQFRPAGEASK